MNATQLREIAHDYFEDPDWRRAMGKAMHRLLDLPIAEAEQIRPGAGIIRILPGHKPTPYGVLANIEAFYLESLYFQQVAYIDVFRWKREQTSPILHAIPSSIILRDLGVKDLLKGKDVSKQPVSLLAIPAL